MAAKVLAKYKQRIRSLKLIPASGGCFELTINGNLIYSKIATGKFPNEEQLVEQIGTTK